MNSQDLIDYVMKYNSWRECSVLRINKKIEIISILIFQN